MKIFIVLSLVVCKFAYASELRLVTEKPKFPKLERDLDFLSDHASWILMELDQRLKSDLKPVLLNVARSLAAMAEKRSEEQKKIEFNALKARYLNLSGLTKKQLRKKLMNVTEYARYRKRRAEKMKFLRLEIELLEKKI